MDVEKKLDEIIELLKKITFSLEKISNMPQYNINIQQADLHNPVLENMDFNLESIDVEELSGPLNLGNNLGVKVKKKESSNMKKAQNKKKKVKKDIKKTVEDIKKSSNSDSFDTSTILSSMDSDENEDIESK